MRRKQNLIGKHAEIGVDRFSGVQYVGVTIIKVTRKGYHVRLDEDTVMPGGRSMKAGDVAFVPKTVVRLENRP